MGGNDQRRAADAGASAPALSPPFTTTTTTATTIDGVTVHCNRVLIPIHSVGSPPNCLDKGLHARTWRVRGLHAKICGPYQDKSDRVDPCLCDLQAEIIADDGDGDAWKQEAARHKRQRGWGRGSPERGSPERRSGVAAARSSQRSSQRQAASEAARRRSEALSASNRPATQPPAPHWEEIILRLSLTFDVGMMHMSQTAAGPNRSLPITVRAFH